MPAPVTDHVFEPLYELFRSLPTDADSMGKSLAKRRSELKLLVDTLTEQIAGNILGQKIRNQAEARLAINRTLNANAQHSEVQILKALSAVLGYYNYLEKDPYVDFSRPLADLVDGPLRELCRILVRHPQLINGQHATNLRAIA